VRGKRSLLIATFAVALVLSIAPPALAASDVSGGASGQFPDVASSSAYASAIRDLATRGIIGGYTNGNFGPADVVIRQQFAKMIVRTLQLPVTGSEVCPFVDVAASAGTDPFYPAKYVAVCALNNITKGTDATHFAPELKIRRAQVVTMVVRAADSLAPGILEEPDAAWTAGVLSYTDPNHGLNIKKAEFNRLLAGIVGPSGALSSWDTSGDATRGEVSQLLHNLRLAKLPALPEGALLHVIKAEGSSVAFTLVQLGAMPAGSMEVDGKTESGVLISAVLQAAGVTDYSKVMLTGSRGTVTVNVIAKADVDANSILDFTNRDTVKVATPAIDKNDWAKDIFVIEVL
jgi:hypothetical protein